MNYYVNRVIIYLSYNLKGDIIMSNNINVKKVGNFVIAHLAPKQVAISLKEGSHAETLTKMKGIVTPTGAFHDLPFEGKVYPGIVFQMPLFMSNNYLETLLFNSK